MTPCLSVPIEAGPAGGLLYWLVETCSFGARLHFDRRHRLLVGGLPGEFITIDGLVNHLRLRGLTLDGRTLDAVQGFRQRVAATFGEVEFVGLADEGDPGLFLLAPDGRSLAVGPAIDHPAHRFGWGSGRAGSATDVEATLRTARSLVGLAWSQARGPGEEMLAQALAHNFLGDCGPDFSLRANSLCDWYLVDCELSTGLTPPALNRLRAGLLH